MPVLRIPTGFRMVWKGRKPAPDAQGEISPYAALMTALAATVGTGNIAGVATAIAIGGPGALFWMWMTALVGMATKYAEVLLAVHYREVDDVGEHAGGPMYAIKNGLGPHWRWLGAAFAIFGGLAAFGIGNMVQSNSDRRGRCTRSLRRSPLDHRRRARGAHRRRDARRHQAHRRGRRDARAVHVHRSTWSAALLVLVIYAADIPTALGLVFAHAFSPVGGLRRLRRRDDHAGDALRRGARHLLQRGRAGHRRHRAAAGQSQDPVASGLVGMMQTFIDTIIVCSFTGLRARWSPASGTAASSAAALTLERLRYCSAGLWRLLPRPRAGDLRLHHDPRLGLLRREVLGVPARAPSSRCPTA